MIQEAVFTTLFNLSVSMSQATLCAWCLLTILIVVYTVYVNYITAGSCQFNSFALGF